MRAVALLFALHLIGSSTSLSTTFCKSKLFCGEQNVILIGKVDRGDDTRLLSELRQKCNFQQSCVLKGIGICINLSADVSVSYRCIPGGTPISCKSKTELLAITPQKSDNLASPFYPKYDQVTGFCGWKFRFPKNLSIVLTLNDQVSWNSDHLELTIHLSSFSDGPWTTLKAKMFIGSKLVTPAGRYFDIWQKSRYVWLSYDGFSDEREVNSFPENVINQISGPDVTEGSPKRCEEQRCTSAGNYRVLVIVFSASLSFLLLTAGFVLIWKRKKIFQCTSHKPPVMRTLQHHGIISIHSTIIGREERDRGDASRCYESLDSPSYVNMSSTRSETSYIDVLPS